MAAKLREFKIGGKNTLMHQEYPHLHRKISLQSKYPHFDSTYLHRIPFLNVAVVWADRLFYRNIDLECKLLSPDTSHYFFFIDVKAMMDFRVRIVYKSIDMKSYTLLTDLFT